MTQTLSRLRKPLTETQWRALVRLWQAGEQGVDHETLQYGPGGFAWSPTLRRLASFTPEPLIEWFKYVPDPYKGSFRITLAGREFYREYWDAYRTRYPTSDAPQPELDE